MNDELVLLWQQGVSAAPDPQEVARLAGRATLSRFDRRILLRNAREYGAGVLLLGVYGTAFVRGFERVASGVSCVGVLFVMAYLWMQHRRLPKLDHASDAQAYQAAMLGRIDHQIKLLGTVRYWYLLPLYIPLLFQSSVVWRRSPGSAVVSLVISTIAFAFIARLNERLGISRLRAERDRIESLYREA